MRWFRFYTDTWLHDTFGMCPNVIAAYITIVCALFDRDGFAELNVPLWSRRCGMRPSSFRKSFEILVAMSKVTIETVDGKAFVTCKSVTDEIISREKLAQKSEKSREKLAEKRKENSEIRQNVSSNREVRIKKDNVRGSALPLKEDGLGSESAQAQRQGYLVHTISGGKEQAESRAVADLRARQAARR